VVSERDREWLLDPVCVARTESLSSFARLVHGLWECQ
jgi:hypothetical protein